MIERLLLISLGGAMGSVSRYLVDVYAQKMLGIFFPFGTLIVNVTGSFLIGYLSIFFSYRFALAESFTVFSLIGFLGAYTTFSTFSLQTYHLLFNHHFGYALLNVMLNVVLCLICVGLGAYIAAPKSV